MTMTGSQGDHLTRLRDAVADRPQHAEFLAIVEDALPGQPLEDLAPTGMARNAVEAIVADFEWITAPAPAPGTYTGGYPGAYAALRLKQARSAAQVKRTREHNDTWSAFRF